jgi:hypothetical protein
MAGLAKTLHYLAETENEAAVPVLLAALHTRDRRRPKQALHCCNAPVRLPKCKS